MALEAPTGRAAVATPLERARPAHRGVAEDSGRDLAPQVSRGTVPGDESGTEQRSVTAEATASNVEVL